MSVCALQNTAEKKLHWMAFTSAVPSSSKIFDPDLEDHVQDQVTAKDLTRDNSAFRGAIDIIPDRPKSLAMYSAL
jgi:hypothetical protein